MINSKRYIGLITGALAIVIVSQASAEFVLPSDAEVSLQLEERVVVDDNILRLSKAEAKLLETNSEFQTDVDGEAAARIEHRIGLGLRVPLKSKTGISALLQNMTGSRAGRGRIDFGYEGKLVQYEGSSSKGYSSHRLTAGWRPRAGWGADLSWRLLNNFYLRQYNDRDTGVVHGCSFDSNEYRLRFRARAADFSPWLRKPTFELSLLFEESFYNGWFTEYDSEMLAIRFKTSVRLPASYSLSFTYGFSVNDNIGFDDAAGSGTVVGNDEGGNSDNEENRLNLTVGWSNTLLAKPFTLDFSLTWRDRYYQSKLGQIADPFHYGRHDRRWLTVLRAGVKLSKRLKLSPFIEREWRISDAPYSRISYYKDYTVLRAGIGLRWIM
jgi:hypothetical protein